MATSVKRAESPLIVIVGPTASGKTALAVKVARQYGGEIISADSRTVYRGMDIGTAKPSVEERAAAPHWGIDLVDPDQSFTVADFKRYADAKIADIRARGRMPILAGGSGLYVDAVLFDYSFGGKADAELRAELEKPSLEELLDYCIKNSIDLPENIRNKRYVMRAIERHNQSIQRRAAPVSTSFIVGIATEKHVLRARIESRAEQILTNGVVEEAITLGKKYGWDSEAMTGNIYPVVRSYLDGECSLEEVRRRFVALDWHLAKRQLTWFRRNPHIVWTHGDEALSLVKSTLATG